jgi:DNA-binding FadR family transcriptional regulator
VSKAKSITNHLLTNVLPNLSVGDELPTIDDLCAQFGVSGVQTVRDGVQPLKDAGYVETRYAPTRRWVVRQLPPAGGDIATLAQRPTTGEVLSPVVLDQLQEELVAARDAVSTAIAIVDRLRLAAQL